jgi:hypothetical protein
MVEPRFLVLGDRVASSIQQAIDQTFSCSFHIPTKTDVWTVGRDIPLDFHALHAAQIALKQQSRPFGVFIAAFNRPLLLKVLHHHSSPQDIGSIEDAVVEITNMLFGLFKSDVNSEGYGLTMGLPVLLHDKESAEGDLARCEKMCLTYSAEGQKCWVAIAQYH